MDQNQPKICPHFMNVINSNDFQTQKILYRREMHWKSNKWQRENPESQNACVRKYEKTEKGKEARKRVYATRNRRYRDQVDQLGDYDKIQIRQFYAKCPPAHHVDHIIPLSKGGKHHISNLQYLSAEENLSKGNKLPFMCAMICEYCDNEMEVLSECTQFCESCNKIFEFSMVEHVKPSE